MTCPGRLESLGLLAMLVFGEAILSGMYPNVRIADDAEELSVAINPQLPSNLLVSAQGVLPARVYVSFDSGHLWSLVSLSAPAYSGDPAVTFDSNGSAFCSYIDFYTTQYLHVKKSIDGGQTWPIDVKVAGGNLKFQDKPMITADRSNSVGSANIYISWTEFDVYQGGPQDSSRILFSRSIDHGTTFGLPMRIGDLAGDARDSSNTVEGAMPAVTPDGTVYVVWTGPRGVQLDRSLDQGVTFGQDRVISDQPGGWDFPVPGMYRCNGLPVVKSDLSSLHPGRLYVCWSDRRNGDVDVFMISSDDGGETLSPLIRVNDDQIGNGRDQFFPWMDVDPASGFIYVVFYDRRESQDNHTDVYLATSTDGGLSFINEKISESSFLPTENHFMGDYIGVAAQSNMIRPVWTRLSGDTLSTWTALIDFPTPVLLGSLSFILVGQSVELRWQASGAQFSQFDVERSILLEDNYERLATITPSPVDEYRWRDESTFDGARWYRVVAMGRDGSESYLGPILVKSRSNPSRLTLVTHSRSEDGSINLLVGTPASGGVQFRLLDLQGRLVQDFGEQALVAGWNELRFPLHGRKSIAQGIYMLSATGMGQTAAKRIMVLR